MFNKLKYGVAAIAIGATLGMAVTAGAQVFSDDIIVSMDVDNTFTVTGTTPVDLGRVSVATSGVGGDPDATIGVSTASARTGPGGGDANNFFIDFGDPVVAGQFDITDAIPATAIDLTIDDVNVDDPFQGAQLFTIIDIEIDDGANSANANPNAAADVTLTTTTDANGEAVILVGVTVQADSTEALYADGAYTNGLIQLDAQY
jgi:hypothetical protein